METNPAAWLVVVLFLFFDQGKAPLKTVPAGGNLAPRSAGHSLPFPVGGRVGGGSVCRAPSRPPGWL